MDYFSTGNELQPVAVTIVARNYIPLARTLSRSFLQQHPDGKVFVLLVDEFDGEFDPAEEQFELVNLDHLTLPFDELFFYQYSILELSTALKPFLMKHLLDEHGLESLLYLDPDLYIAAPLTSVYEALLRSSIVLTPHMLTPPDDGLIPTERDIMLSGVYNLGFLGIRNDANAARMLSWWAERLATQCIVDHQNAIFVDQRWMDLSPAYFEGVEILKDQTLNVAYWNLFERKLTQQNSAYYVNGSPLKFFHFSGFKPNHPESLSKFSPQRGQGNQAVAAICGQYAQELFKNGYHDFSKIPVAFSRLANGASLGRFTEFVVRRALELKINFPWPRQQPDEFCRFLMTPNYQFDVRGIAPLLLALEKFRPEVKAAYPRDFESSKQVSNVRNWLLMHGGKEEGIPEIIDRFESLLDRVDTVRHALDVWISRDDLRRAYPNAFATKAGSEAFAQWLSQQGIDEEDFNEHDSPTFLARRQGLIRVLMLYMQDGNLQSEFKLLFLKQEWGRYVDWLYTHACQQNLVTPEEVAWFEGFAESSPDILAEIVLGHSVWLHANLLGGGTVFDLRQLRNMLYDSDIELSGDFLIRLYTGSSGSEPFAQAERYYYASQELQDTFPALFSGGKNCELFVDKLIKQLMGELQYSQGLRTLGLTSEQESSSTRPPSKISKNLKGKSKQPKLAHEPDLGNTALLENLRTYLLSRFSELHSAPLGVNLVGFFHSPTGMGEAARTMSRVLQSANIARKEVPLPTTVLGPWLDIGDIQAGRLFSAYDPANQINIIMANGDNYPHVRGRLPDSIWHGRTNVGWWVWETEKLPSSFSNTYGLTEIWTCSEYAATAIRKAVDISVRVLPLSLDFSKFEPVLADRAKFGLPEHALIFGFFFDCKSVIERKNPRAILKAFRKAFGSGNRNVRLLLKANSPDVSPFEFAQLKRESEGLNVIWITDTLSSEDTLCLMKSLDVYVSLHRSEGFGLTLAEAMAMGKPVIATNYSANTEFMTVQDSLLVRTKVIETDKAYGPYAAGTRWGDPDVDHAAEFMVKMLDPETRAEIGENAATVIRHKLNETKIGHLVANHLSRLEKIRKLPEIILTE